MNDFNEFDNMQRFSTENINSQHTEQPEISPVQKKPPKYRKNNATLKVMAMIAAVVIVGGSAGFGGAYLAGRSGASAVIRESGSSSEINSENSSGAGGSGTSGSVGVENISTPTLNELQQGVGVQHNVNDNIEFNTDGTYAYTRDLVKAVQDSIVYIEVFVDYHGSSTLYGSASGIIISKDGYIVTNHHVVENCDSFTVKVNFTNNDSGASDSKTYDAVLLGSDKDTDLAVLKIDADNLPAAKLGDSDQLHLGDDVIAIGNPLGLETSVSKGIVSGLNRQLSDSQRGLSSIQTDAAINSGNSGGALFNTYGEVVGVVNSKYVIDYAESLGFAITINEAKDVIDDLISKGYVSGRAGMGIMYLEITESAAAYRGGVPGWQVTDISDDMPVSHSGLIVGDTIVKIDGISVLESSASEIFAGKKPGDVVTVTVVRTDSLGRDKEVDIEVELDEYKGS